MIEWNPEQYGNCWFRVYLTLAMQCNVNVLDAVYCATPWNTELIQERFYNQYKDTDMQIEFRQNYWACIEIKFPGHSNFKEMEPYNWRNCLHICWFCVCPHPNEWRKFTVAS